VYQYVDNVSLLRLGAGAIGYNNAWLFFGTGIVTTAAAFYLVREAAQRKGPS
jgi:hypothetical protein